MPPPDFFAHDATRYLCGGGEGNKEDRLDFTLSLKSQAKQMAMEKRETGHGEKRLD